MESEEYRYANNSHSQIVAEESFFDVVYSLPTLISNHISGAQLTQCLIAFASFDNL